MNDVSACAQSFLDNKVDVPEEHFDRLASPVASLVVVTTVDQAGRVNASPIATCLRNSHHPTCFEFTVDTSKHTAENVLSTEEFVVNVVPFERSILERVLVTSLPFPKGVNELDVAKLTAIPARTVRPPRIGECRSHFECRLEWSKQWRDTRLTIVGRVLAASVNRDCIDAQGFVIHERLAAAQHCGQVYGGKFLGGHQLMSVDMVYDGPDPRTFPQGSV